MLTALKQLILKWACMHSWEEKFVLTNTHRLTGCVVEYTHTYCCTKCGKFKQIKSS